jgi:GT2 family glycosyltransferase|tara:strand:+ start:42 stop:899 length:858 start_codon:yes stop_codon:yes gene_type:complete
MEIFQKITIQIVLYEEDKETIFNCLNNLKNFKIVILDNSTNYSLKDDILKNFNIEQYIIERKNLGYSKGHNKASTYVNTEYLLILNADCIINKKNIINLLVAHKKYKNCAITAPTTHDKEMKLSYNGGLLPENGYKDYITNISGDTCFQSVLGSAMLIKKKDFIDIGKFNESLFLFYSDDDLCRKFKKSNKSVIQIFSSKAYHSHGVSKVKNIFKRIYLKEFNMTYDELFYHSKIIKSDERFYKLKKKISNYYIKLLISFLILNFKKVTFYYAKILAFNKFKAIK